MFKNQKNILKLPLHQPLNVKWVSFLSRPLCPHHTVNTQNIFCTHARCSSLLTWQNYFKLFLWSWFLHIVNKNQDHWSWFLCYNVWKSGECIKICLHMNNKNMSNEFHASQGHHVFVIQSTPVVLIDRHDRYRFSDSISRRIMMISM